MHCHCLHLNPKRRTLVHCWYICIYTGYSFDIFFQSLIVSEYVVISDRKESNSKQNPKFDNDMYRNLVLISHLRWLCLQFICCCVFSFIIFLFILNIKSLKILHLVYISGEDVT